MDEAKTDTRQDKVTHVALKQYRERLVDHNLIQGELDGYTHYHQGILVEETQRRYCTHRERDTLIHESETHLSEFILDKLNTHVPHPQEVLDVGCGKFGTGLMYAQKNKSVKVCGIDISRYSIHYARQLPMVSKEPHRFNLMSGNYLHTEFEPASFDVIYAIESIQFCVDLSSLFATWRKAIKEDGAIAISAMVSDDTKPLVDVARIVGQINAGYETLFHGRKCIEDHLHENGLEVVEAFNLTNDVINYWRLRQDWGFKGYSDMYILSGYETGLIQYWVYIAKVITAPKRKEEMLLTDPQPWKYFQRTYKTVIGEIPLGQVIIESEIVQTALSYVRDKAEMKIHPAMSYMVAIVYATMLSKTYDVGLLDVLNDPDLFLGRDPYFVPYANDSETYNQILTELKYIPGWMSGKWVSGISRQFHAECTQQGLEEAILNFYTTGIAVGH